MFKERVNQSLKDSLEWGFVRYRPEDGLDIRAGRLGTDIFMLTDYRQVGYAYPWVRPPHEYYGLLSFYHFDGMDLTKKFHFESADLSTKLFYGRSQESYPLTENATQSYRLDFIGGGLTSVLDYDNWKFRISLADVQLTNNNPFALIDALTNISPVWPGAMAVSQYFLTKNKRIRFSEFGFNYDANSWWIQGEHTILDIDAPIISSSDFSYLILGARVKKFSVFTTYSEVKPRDNNIHIDIPQGLSAPLTSQIAALAAASEYALKSSRANEHSLGVGVRWDFKPKMALKLQIDKYDIQAFGSSIWLKRDGLRGNNAQGSLVTSMTWDFVF